MEHPVDFSEEQGPFLLLLLSKVRRTSFVLHLFIALPHMGRYTKGPPKGIIGICVFVC